MNKVILMGRLVRDPEIITAGEGEIFRRRECIGNCQIYTGSRQKIPP